jgi:hypothetical protein
MGDGAAPTAALTVKKDGVRINYVKKSGIE